jgi:hypothetical protein
LVLNNFLAINEKYKVIRKNERGSNCWVLSIYGRNAQRKDLQTFKGTEEKLEGITFYEEVRDFILQELRRFRDPYVVGTEVVHPRDEEVPRMSDSLDDEMLITLREIRNGLERIDEKLDKEDK